MSHALSRKYATPLHLDIGPSRLLGGWVLLVHGAPLLMWPVLQPAGWLMLAVTSALLFSLVRSWRMQVSRQHPDAVCSMAWGAVPSWVVPEVPALKLSRWLQLDWPGDSQKPQSNTFTKHNTFYFVENVDRVARITSKALR